MASQDYVASYYAASAHVVPERPALEGGTECDVCVVGGGIAGCSTALHLAEKGLSVVLLEQHRVGWGASGRSGGQAIFGVAAGPRKLERLIGADGARAVWDVSVEALTLVRELIARFKIDCDWTSGYLLTAVRERHVRELEAEVHELRERFGYPSVRYVAREELRALVASERYLGALYDSNSGHLHPLNYTLGIAAAAESRGVRIFEGTRAGSFTSGGAAAVRVRTPRGEVRARFLVLCGNVYLGATAPALASKIMGVATYIVATEPLGAERARQLITNNAAVCDMNWVLDYFRRSGDHRLLFGGRVNYSGLRSFDAPGATRARMLTVFPQLAGTRIDFAWGGDVDITLNRAPHFGRLAPNIYFLQGFSGHGLALTGIAGKLVAEAISGTAARFDVFARIPHANFPGGAALRRPALVLAMLWYRLRDLL
ncbi:MAG TPA: FAD-binding oxidoreductase [Steroidobacteraceae bacterium]|jgi:gamma-glutamylputrescine oxidase|nr:FAD-binding oxidoreductase [Steroidobacteraceae bacterium]